MLNKIIKYSHRSKLFSCQVLAVLLVGLLVAPTQSLAQGSGRFITQLEIDDDLNFGVWSGAEIIQGNLVPQQNDVFCIIYETLFQNPNRLTRVNYDLRLNGPSDSNGYVLQGSGENLPVNFLVSPAAGSTISVSGNPEAGLNPGSRYDVTFPNPALSFGDLNDPTYAAPGGCNDARFDFEVSVDFADIIDLSNPTGTYTSDFTIAARAPGFLRFFLGFFGGSTDLIDFTVSITIESSVYIDQLSDTIDLNSQTQEDFCVWSFDGSAVNLTASSDNPGSFTLENQDSLGVTVDSIPYVLQLQSLYNASTSTLTNGVPQTGLTTESAASGGVSCNGPQGLNYRLNFNVSNSSGKAAGDYTDRITLTVAPN